MAFYPPVIIPAVSSLQHPTCLNRVQANESFDRQAPARPANSCCAGIIPTICGRRHQVIAAKCQIIARRMWLTDVRPAQPGHRICQLCVEIVVCKCLCISMNHDLIHSYKTSVSRHRNIPAVSWPPTQF